MGGGERVKKIITASAVILVVLLVSLTVLGCQSPLQSLVAQSLPQGAPANTAEGDAGQPQQIELNGVIVNVPAGWQIQTVAGNPNHVIRLVYTGTQSKGPWIELTPAVSNLAAYGITPPAPETTASGMISFPGSAINASGEVVNYTYIPSKNVMLSAGYQTPEQHALIQNIVSNIRFSAP